MIPRWFASFLRHTFAPRRSPQAPRPARPRARVRLEGLEDREMPATVAVDAPAWWGTVNSYTASFTTEETRTGQLLDPAGGPSQPVAVQFGPAGMVRLLNAVASVSRLAMGDIDLLPSPTAPSSVAPPAPPPASVPGSFADTPGGATTSGVSSSANTTYVVTRTLLVQVQSSAAFALDAARGLVVDAPARPAPAPNNLDAKPATPEAPRAEPEPSAPTETPRPNPAPAPSVVPRGAPETGRAATPPATASTAPVAPVTLTTRADHVAAGSPAQQSAVPDPSHPLRGTPASSGTATDWSGPRVAPDPARPAPDARQAVVAATDGALLRRFAAERDQAAFAELVQRHGRAVLAVSTRVLGDADRALDASQVTFAALARRAAALEDRGSLAGWLHQVARRMALRLRATVARQRKLEQIAAEFYEDADDALLAVEQEDVFRALREELDRLPDKYRLPLTLCYLDGMTHADVGRSVGLPRGSVAKRIAEGLARLRDRLAERGFLL